jgi:hypothetical protein
MVFIAIFISLNTSENEGKGFVFSTTFPRSLHNQHDLQPRSSRSRPTRSHGRSKGSLLWCCIRCTAKARWQRNAARLNIRGGDIAIGMAVGAMASPTIRGPMTKQPIRGEHEKRDESARRGAAESTTACVENRTTERVAMKQSTRNKEKKRDVGELVKTESARRGAAETVSACVKEWTARKVAAKRPIQKENEDDEAAVEATPLHTTVSLVKNDKQSRLTCEHHRK